MKATGVHLVAGARGRLRLVRDDRDRYTLVKIAAREVGRLLAYCVMDTHIHIVAAGDVAEAEKAVARVMAAYLRYFNRRHRTSLTVRTEVKGVVKEDAFELARAI